MFIIVIIIIIKSTRLTINQRKGLQGGKGQGGTPLNTLRQVDRVLQMAKKFVGTQLA